MQLKGPENDVRIFSTLLKEQFAVPGENIVVLAEGEGSDQLPTRSRIEAEFRRLAAVVGKGDQVLILLAGHGSRQPDQQTHGDERDGLDEMFLPRDIGRWDGKVGLVQNAITDDEISEWLTAIRNRGAQVLFVADTCHSGTMSRGDAAVSRDVRSEDLGVPPNEIAEAVKRTSPVANDGEASRGTTEESHDVAGASANNEGSGSLIAFYAAHPYESTYEEAVPKGGESHGWLSWALCKSLGQSSSDRLTYRELAQRINWIYEQEGWIRSHPLVEAEAEDLDREVLGIQLWSGRSRIQLRRSEAKDLTINAGTLHGINDGSVLAVLANDHDVPAGFVRVLEATPMQAKVEPAEHDGIPANPNLPVPATCELKFRSVSDYQLWVSADTSLIEDANLQSQVDAQLKNDIEAASKSPDAMLRLTPAGKTADWYLVASSSGDHVEMVSATDLLRNDRGRPDLNNVQTFGPYEIDKELSDKLLTECNKLARAQNLRRLAELQGGEGEAVKLDIKAERLVDERRILYTPLRAPAPNVHDGDAIRVIIRNPTKSNVDVTVLYVQSDGMIDCFFPKNADFNRLGPEESHIIRGIRINVKTTGLEDLIVIGVPAGDAPLPASFAFLKQPNLQKAGDRQRSRGMTSGDWDSPLGLLTRGLVFNEPGQARGAHTSDLSTFTIQRISWNVVKSGN